MSRKPNTRISPATPVALVALFVALGGVSYAAATIGTSDLQNGAVTKKKLHRNAVAPGKIRNGAVVRKKLRNGAVNGPKIAADAVTGDKVVESSLGKVPSAASADSATNADTAASVGPDGVDTQALKGGAVTAPKLAATAVHSETLELAAESTDFESVSCQPGERMLSGGAIWNGSFELATAAKLHLVYSAPSGNGWIVRAYNGTGEPRSIVIRVVCLTG